MIEDDYGEEEEEGEYDPNAIYEDSSMISERGSTALEDLTPYEQAELMEVLQE